MDDSRVEIGRRKEPLWSQRWSESLGLFLVVASVFLLLPQRTLLLLLLWRKSCFSSKKI